MNIHRINNYLTLTLDDGTTLTTNECTDEVFNKIMQHINDRDTLIGIFYPDYAESQKLRNRILKSKHMTMEGNSIYIKSISELTVPQDFAEKLIDAEEANDVNKIQAYLNFWTLLSLNPDSRVRNNLFRFLKQWGMVVSKSGLIVGYRNVDIKTEGSKFNQNLTKFVSQKYWEKKYSNNDSPEGYIVIMRDDDYFVTGEDYEMDDEDVYIGDLVDLYTMLTTDSSEQTTVFTDHHSGTFRIRLGHIVSMPREKCCADQTKECQAGLHIGGKDWLEKHYFGDVGLQCLINPADVVACPMEHNAYYGKMRTCAYYPVKIVNYNDAGHISDDIESGFEDDFINKICYTGTINNEDNDNYTLNIPDIAEVDKAKVYRNLKELALKCMSNRNN